MTFRQRAHRTGRGCCQRVRSPSRAHQDDSAGCTPYLNARAISNPIRVMAKEPRLATNVQRRSLWVPRRASQPALVSLYIACSPTGSMTSTSSTSSIHSVLKRASSRGSTQPRMWHVRRAACVCSSLGKASSITHIFSESRFINARCLVTRLRITRKNLSRRQLSSIVPPAQGSRPVRLSLIVSPRSIAALTLNGRPNHCSGLPSPHAMNVLGLPQTRRPLSVRRKSLRPLATAASLSSLVYGARCRRVYHCATTIQGIRWRVRASVSQAPEPFQRFRTRIE